MKLYPILSQISQKDLSLIIKYSDFFLWEPRKIKTSILSRLQFTAEENPDLDWPYVIAELYHVILNYYEQISFLHLNGTQNLIYPLLANREDGIAEWSELEGECIKFARPSTFSRKIHELTWTAYAFVVERQGAKKGRFIVIPEELLGRVRQILNDKSAF